MMALLTQRLLKVEPEYRPIDTVLYVVNARAFVASPATRLILSQYCGVCGYPTNPMINAHSR